VVDDTGAAIGRGWRGCCGGLRLYEGDSEVRLDETIRFTSFFSDPPRPEQHWFLAELLPLRRSSGVLVGSFSQSCAREKEVRRMRLTN
jgi:hypothetical protein